VSGRPNRREERIVEAASLILFGNFLPPATTAGFGHEPFFAQNQILNNAKTTL